MSTEQDLLELLSPPDRVYYATGVLLDATDFQAEQTYHRGRLARALACLHGSGTVAGLKVEYQPAVDGQDEQIVVNPGLALDRIGRVIEVPRRACIRLDRWYAAQDVDALKQALHPRTPPVLGDPYNGVVVDVFVRFVACERGKTPSFAAGDYQALDAVVPSRLRDGYELKLVLRPEDTPQRPQDHWPDLEGILDPADRHAAVMEKIFSAWPQDNHDATKNPEPPNEYVPDQDQTSVFLARMQIPATPDGGGAAPKRAAGVVAVDNSARLFIYRGRALAKGVGL